MDTKSILNFCYEMGMLRRVPRSGWGLIMIDAEEGESVAEHSLRAAQIGYILAIMEEYENPFEVVTMLVFHDSHETRTGDPNKVQRRYMEVDEEMAAAEQYDRLGHAVGPGLLQLWKHVEDQSNPAGTIAKDADALECALSARERIEQGYKAADDWMNNVSDRLSTKSAKMLADALFDSDPNDWWRGLKKM